MKWSLLQFYSTGLQNAKMYKRLFSDKNWENGKFETFNFINWYEMKMATSIAQKRLQCPGIIKKRKKQLTNVVMYR